MLYMNVVVVNVVWMVFKYNVVLNGVKWIQFKYVLYFAQVFDKMPERELYSLFS